MKVILLQDVKSLGYKDDLVTVKGGYGRNFLIPQGMGRLATESAVKMLNEDLKQREFKKERVRTDAEALAGKLNGLNLAIATKTGTSGKIFGSITILHFANLLKEKGFEVDRRKIVLNEEIKHIGNYTAVINLYKDINAEITIDVTAE